jgi:UDP-N-acetyl-2-amino-2-deoxyglucuronate dehydrogenase
VEFTAKHSIIAAKNKINILCEKPMATKYNDAREMIKECDNNNVRLFVVKQNRRNPTIQLLKKTIDDERLVTLI